MPFRIANNVFEWSIRSDRYLGISVPKPSELEEKKWYYATVTWSKTNNYMKFYLNGELKTT